MGQIFNKQSSYLLSQELDYDINDSIAEQSTDFSVCPEYRNVVIIGKKKSGKSTLIELLKSPFYQPPAILIATNETKIKYHIEPILVSLTSEKEEKTSRVVQLNCLEIPGFQSVNEINYDDINQIFEILKEVSFNIIHAIVLTVSYRDGIDRNEIEEISTFFKSCRHPNMKVLVCVMNSETLTNESKSRIKSELLNNTFFHEIIKQNHPTLNSSSPSIIIGNRSSSYEEKSSLEGEVNNVIFMGCVTVDLIQKYCDEGSITSFYKRIIHMQEYLLTTIFDSSPVHLIELPISSIHKTKISSLLDSVNQFDFKKLIAMKKDRNFFNRLDNDTRKFFTAVDELISYQWLYKSVPYQFQKINHTFARLEKNSVQSLHQSFDITFSQYMKFGRN